MLNGCVNINCKRITDFVRDFTEEDVEMNSCDFCKLDKKNLKSVKCMSRLAVFL